MWLGLLKICLLEVLEVAKEKVYRCTNHVVITHCGDYKQALFNSLYWAKDT